MTFVPPYLYTNKAAHVLNSKLIVLGLYIVYCAAVRVIVELCVSSVQRICILYMYMNFVSLPVPVINRHLPRTDTFALAQWCPRVAGTTGVNFRVYVCSCESLDKILVCLHQLGNVLELIERKRTIKNQIYNHLFVLILICKT